MVIPLTHHYKVLYNNESSCYRRVFPVLILHYTKLIGV